MKVFAASLLLGSGYAAAFAPTLSAIRSTDLRANVLEGTEIENDLQPINNMLLVKKVDAIDKTEGGLFLTGKVSFPRYRISPKCSTTRLVVLTLAFLFFV